MTNVFVLVQGQENRVQLQQTASQLEVHEQQVASQLEVHEQQVKEVRITQEKARETKMTGMVYTFAFPFRQTLHGEGDHIPLI